MIVDVVFAHDPETGQAGPREVLATWPHTDTLVEFEVGDSTVTATEDHEFWNVTDQAWQETQHIDAGDLLLTADGATVEAGTLLWDTAHVAPAFDLTIDEIHAYHVTAGDESVLVHNTDCEFFEGPPESATFSGSDGGPGEWTDIGRGERGLDYQQEVTTAPQSTRDATGSRTVTECRVNGVNFDGYDPGRDVLLDAKDWENFPSNIDNPPDFIIEQELDIARLSLIHI